jgi:predicted dehydrogenase
MHRVSGGSRRDFLKTSLLAAGAGLTSAPRRAAARILGANDRIRIGAIGTGSRCRYLMRVLSQLEGNELVAVNDVYEPRLLQAAEIAASGAAQHADYRRILDDPEIDAVVIGSPDHWHRQMTLDALAAGKDVFLEKPVSHSLKEGAELMRAVEASDRVVQTGTQQRSWDHYELGKQIVDSGRLGHVAFVHSYWYQRMSPWDTPPEVEREKLDWQSWLGPAPEQPFDVERFLRWRHFWDFGGGVLTDLMTHWIDVVHWYLDVDAPLTAMTTAANHRFESWDAPDTVTATMEYPGRCQVTHTGTYSSSIDRGGLEFRGDQATLKVDRSRLALYSETSRGSATTPEPEVFVRSLADGAIPHLQNWLDCMRSRAEPTASMRVAHAAARAAHIANDSLRVGERVRWDEGSARVEVA